MGRDEENPFYIDSVKAPEIRGEMGRLWGEMGRARSTSTPSRRCARPIPPRYPSPLPYLPRYPNPKAFRDRRYEYKGKNKEWSKRRAQAEADGDAGALLESKATCTLCGSNCHYSPRMNTHSH